MSGIRRALWACAVMMVVPLHAPPAHAWPTIGLSPQELQAIISRKMPVTHKVGQIDSPEVRLQAPRLTKGTLSGGGQLPGPITDLLNLLLGTLIKDLTVYKANALTCSLVKEIRVTADRLEIHL